MVPVFGAGIDPIPWLSGGWLDGCVRLYRRARRQYFRGPERSPRCDNHWRPRYNPLRYRYTVNRYVTCIIRDVTVITLYVTGIIRYVTLWTNAQNWTTLWAWKRRHRIFVYSKTCVGDPHWFQLWSGSSILVHLRIQIQQFRSIRFRIPVLDLGFYRLLVGFGRACAPGRCAHPSFLDSLTCKTGRCAPPRPSQLRCFLFTPQNFPSGPNSGSQGCVYLSIGLSCTLLSYIASYWATLVHPKSYAAPSELSWILLSYVAPFWATLDPIYSKLSCAL
jgi:hypothetical protein